MFSTFVAISSSPNRLDDSNSNETRISGPSSSSSTTASTSSSTPAQVPPRAKRNQVSRACEWCRVHRIKCDKSLPCQNCRNRGENCIKKSPAEIRTLPHAVRLYQHQPFEHVHYLEPIGTNKNNLK